jgi:signal transduction histidine kinase
MTRIDAQGWVSVTVADSGPGLDPEVRLKIFHPFKTAKPAGMGIGLTLCRLIAEAHGARIGVAESLPGSGAVFVLSLPPILNPAASSADEAIADRLCRR